MDQKKSVPFDKLLQAVALGNIEPEVLSSVAARLARLDRDLTEADKRQGRRGQRRPRPEGPGARHRRRAEPRRDDRSAAARPSRAAPAPSSRCADPALRELLLKLQAAEPNRSSTPSRRTSVIEAGFCEAAARARQGHGAESSKPSSPSTRTKSPPCKSSTTARSASAPLKFEDLKALADTLQAPPHLWTESQLWQAYAALDKSKVKGASRRRILTDLGQPGALRHAPGQRTRALPRARHRQLQGLAGAAAAARASRSPPNNSTGWK